ncbi:MAG: 30S ribosomal protein S4 [Candidatus Calescibacterium sp.]|nr:30S ribosomal protein S4 [Candidatus Calescibacterium sp.]
MAIKTDSVCRKCRRYGMKLYLKGQKCYTEKCPFEKRPFPPGVHGKSRRFARVSDYAVRFFEKQKLKNYYFMREEQFRRFFEMAQKAKGNTGTKLLELLERRLDNVVFRSGFALSRRNARILVSHGHVKVNGIKTDIPSYIVDVGDEVEIEKELLPQNSAAKLPSWIEKIDDAKIKITRLPERQDFDLKINESYIIEFYSR